MIILRKTYSDTWGVRLEQKEFKDVLDFMNDMEIDASKYKSDIAPKVIQYKRTKSNVPTLNLADSNVFNMHRQRGQEAINRETAKKSAVQSVRNKSGQSAKNKSLRRQRDIEEFAWKGEKTTGLSEGMIRNSAGKKVTFKNPDWNKAGLETAQAESLRSARKSSRRHGGSIGINRQYGSGKEVELTKQQRFARLSDKSKARIKQNQAARRKAQAELEAKPLSKSQRIQRLSEERRAQLFNNNSKNVHGVSRSELQKKRYASRGGDSLANKGSKEIRIGRLSQKRQQQLMENRSKRAPKQLPAVIEKGNVSVPEVINKPKTTKSAVIDVPVKTTSSGGSKIKTPKNIKVSRLGRKGIIGGSLGAVALGGGLLAYNKYKNKKKE